MGKIHNKGFQNHPLKCQTKYLTYSRLLKFVFKAVSMSRGSSIKADRIDITATNILISIRNTHGCLKMRHWNRNVILTLFLSINGQDIAIMTSCGTAWNVECCQYDISVDKSWFNQWKSINLRFPLQWIYDCYHLFKGLIMINPDYNMMPTIFLFIYQYSAH